MELECFVYGAGHGEEGVCLLVYMGPHRILLDCGIADIDPLRVGTSPPADFVLCSHAHPDRARGLLRLHWAFPQLPVYASEVTASLLPLNWLNYSRAEIPDFCRSLAWRHPHQLAEGLEVTYFPAGHLPGAAVVLLSYTPSATTAEPARPVKLLYMVDFLLSKTRLVAGLALEDLQGIQPDVLAIGGSYGTAKHRYTRREQEKQTIERIALAIAEGYSVLLPVPTLGIGQELLALLRVHQLFTGKDVDIWVDGAVAAGCDAYLEILPYLPGKIQNFAQHQPLFWDEQRCPRVRRYSPEAFRQAQFPCIVFTDESTNLTRYLSVGGQGWLILLAQKPGYPLLTQNWLMQGDRAPQVLMEVYLLAQHADISGTKQVIHSLRPQHVLFIHGSPTYLADLTNLPELRNRYHLHSPESGTRVELPIGEVMLQPPVFPNTYEGELSIGPSVAIVTLPDEITADARWQDFADTGFVEARWQGEEIVLRGISQRELLNQGDRPMPPTLECCGRCHFYQGLYCHNPASPLCNLKVTPDGYCPAFVPIGEEDSDDGE